MAIAEIRARIDTLAAALRAKDVPRLMAHYAPTNVTFDLRPPLQVVGADGYQKNFEAWFASVEGPIGYELRDVRIAASGDLGFAHYLGHVRSTRTSGDKTEYWVRVTTAFQKLNGEWMVVHEHVSMPFRLDTMQAAADLQP